MVAAVQKISSFVLKPVTVPIKWIIEKIRWLVRKFFGFILRVSVFQLGEYKKPFSYFIMRVYQRLMSDPREEKPLDHARLAESESLLLQFGAQPMSVPFAGWKSQVRTKLFTPDNFFQRVDELGGKKTKITLRSENGQVEDRFAILPDPKGDRSSYKELLEILEKKFSLPRISIQVGKEVQTGILLPQSPKTKEGQKTPLIFYSHSPGRSMDMDRKILALFLAAGYHVCVWDPPGTIDSTGTPSEGSYYLAADAILQKLLSLGYELNRICVSGYCEGGVTAGYLKAKYHKEGIHFAGQNLFNSLADMAKNQSWLGRLFADLSLPEIQSTDPAITRRVKQNGMDLEDWFKDLPQSDGIFFIAHTNTDRMVPPDSVKRLVSAINNAGPCIIHEWIHPNPKSNGHLDMPLLDPLVWKRFVEVIC